MVRHYNIYVIFWWYTFILPVFAANVSLGKPCYTHAQCDGLLNSTICGAANGSKQLTCKCNTGFIESKNVCLKGNYYLKIFFCIIMRKTYTMTTKSSIRFKGNYDVWTRIYMQCVSKVSLLFLPFFNFFAHLQCLIKDFSISR